MVLHVSASVPLAAELALGRILVQAVMPLQTEPRRELFAALLTHRTQRVQRLLPLAFAFFEFACLTLAFRLHFGGRPPTDGRPLNGLRRQHHSQVLATAFAAAHFVRNARPIYLVRQRAGSAPATARQADELPLGRMVDAVLGQLALGDEACRAEVAPELVQ